MPSHQIKIQAPPELHAELSQLAAAEEMTLSQFCLKHLHAVAGSEYKPYVPYFGTVSAKKARAYGQEAAAARWGKAKRKEGK